jgi:hypothetical protein
VVQTVAENQVTLRELKESFGLELTQDASFFLEWRSAQALLGEADRQLLDRVKENFTALMEDLPMLENTVKMRSEAAVRLEIEDEEGQVYRGRIDGLIVQEHLWIILVEPKRTSFNVEVALPQALAYMTANSLDRPTFGLVSNGAQSMFLKLDQAQYDFSDDFSLNSRRNELYDVLRILHRLKG